MEDTIAVGDRVRETTDEEVHFGEVISSPDWQGMVQVKWDRSRISPSGVMSYFLKVPTKHLEVQQPAVKSLDKTISCVLTNDFLSDIAVDTLSRGLEVLASLEAEVQYLGGDPDALVPTQANVTMFLFALNHEVGEVADELTWKRWKRGAVPNPEAAMQETADVLAFFGLLLNWLKHHGVPMRDLASEFVRKSRVNVERLSGRVADYGMVEE